MILLEVDQYTFSAQSMGSSEFCGSVLALADLMDRDLLKIFCHHPMPVYCLAFSCRSAILCHALLEFLSFFNDFLGVVLIGLTVCVC
jgi:hypothetical protein